MGAGEGEWGVSVYRGQFFTFARGWSWLHNNVTVLNATGLHPENDQDG